MGKYVKRVAVLALIVAGVWLWGLLTDSGELRENILRLHVVAASDSQEDQAVKLQVRDAILASLEDGLEDLTDMDQALEYVDRMLPALEQIANQVLNQAKISSRAKVTLAEEAFPVREYDTFSLPSGVYHSLRVVIGEGQGQNWWCVVFPRFCYGSASGDFVETAVLNGMDERLTGTLAGEYEIRFWLLDKVGQLGNFLRNSSE